MKPALITACAGILLTSVLVQTAEAYPTQAKKANGTVTGIYGPLDLSLTSVVTEGSGLSYDDGPNFTFGVDLAGTFAGVDYDVSGLSGTWEISLSNSFDTDNTSVTVNPGNVIVFATTAANTKVGTLTYLGGLEATGTLPAADTPLSGDVFDIFASSIGTVATATCDSIATCLNFDLTTFGSLELQGPYIPSGATAIIDTTRQNTACADSVACGTFALTASTVPEPATLALVGLGLAGLGLSRRNRQ